MSGCACAVAPCARGGPDRHNVGRMLAAAGRAGRGGAKRMHGYTVALLLDDIGCRTIIAPRACPRPPLIIGVLAAARAVFVTTKLERCTLQREDYHENG